MKPSHLTRRTIAALALGFVATVSFAQGYPKVPANLKAAAEARKAAADQRSDEAFAQALPEIQAWASKGKPYLPNAAKPTDLPQAAIPAFPGAWGGGMYSFGGRGGKVIVVTNLNDSGPGSFRAACEAGGPRIIVFNVAGIIRLQDHLRIRAPYVTIVGNTAPGDGVCIAGNTVEVETHDVVIRHLRFRRGETDPADRDDSLGGKPVGNLIIDHVSTSWSLDENLSAYFHWATPGGGKQVKTPTVNITIQNSISSESLSTYHHAFGSTIGGLNSTFHHNLWACNTGRNPSVGMYGDFTFANNVLFNWRHRTIDGGDHRSAFNIIGNYFKPGPGTPSDEDVAYRILKPESERSRTAVNHFGKAYVAGNVVEGNARVTKDNWDGGVQPDVVSPKRKFSELMEAAPKPGPKRDEFAAKTKAQVDSLKFYVETEADALKTIRVNEPFAHAPFPLTSAQEAFDYVVANAGAYLPTRDAVDTRVLEQVRTGKIPSRTISPETPKLAKFYGYQQKFTNELPGYVAAGFVTHPSEVGGYPEYKGTPYVDSDGDGMPDAWETAHGLNPHDATDAVKDANGDGYTNIEKFIYGLDPRAPKTDWTDLKNNVDPLAKK